VRGNPPGERCAAQPSGRPHEPSGNRRPQMDGHPRRFAAATELGLQAASLTPFPTLAARSTAASATLLVMLR
jgi:hypothetical protein